MDYFWGDSEALPLALQHGERALALDRNEPTALRILALTLAKHRRADEGVRMLERAVTIVPGSADNAAGMGICLVHAGRHDDALEWLSKALRLDPFQGEWVYEFLGIAHYFMHRFTDAIAAFERIVEPPSWICALFAAAFAMNGDDAAAKDQVRVYARTIEREYESRLTVEQAMKLTTELYQVFKRPEDRRLAVDGFRKAGLPE